MSAPRVIRLLSLAGLALLATCDDQPPTAPAIDGPMMAVSDAAHLGGNPDFFFLPPLVPDPSGHEEFDANGFDATQPAEVEICVLSGDDCGEDIIAYYSMETGPGSETVRVSEPDGPYIVNWHTDEFPLSDTETYRVTVLVAETPLGYADVRVYATAKAAKNANTGHDFALKDGRTLPIKFRIEQGAVTVVGTDGGTVEFGDGAATIVLAEGTVSGSVGLTGWPATDYPDTADLIPGTVYRLGPEDLTFNEANPATLTISYDPATPPPDKYPWLHKVIDGVWERAPGSTADLTAGSVSAPITGFSTFGVVKIACRAEITGTVTVAGVVPQAGIMISATQAGGGTTVGAVTRSDGSYQMILPVVLGPPTTWTVTVQVLGHDLHATVTVEPCVTTTTVDLTVTLETLLEAATPRLADFIVWETPSGTVAYRDWSSSEKDELETYFVAALSGGASLADPPPNLLAEVLPDNEWAETILAADAARALYLANVGHSLAMEFSEQFPWSLMEYSDAALSILLDSRTFLRWEVHWTGVSGYQLHLEDEIRGLMPRDVLPAPPSVTYGFLTQHNMVGEDRVSTVARVFDWAREHMVHSHGRLWMWNAEDYWQYRGATPVSRVLSGTSHPNRGFNSWTPGCHGTNLFLQDLLRAVNIPVQRRVVARNPALSYAGHAAPFFIADGLTLPHGDDLYDLYYRIHSSADSIPSTEFFIDEATWEAWFDPSVPEPVQSVHMGRRTAENAVTYLPDYLLYERCEDITADRSPGESLSLLGRYYELAELEAAGLWQRADAKIAPLGGCPILCASWLTAWACHSSLEVTTSTTGQHVDPDGYAVLVDGLEAAGIAVNGTARVTELWPRQYSVELSGLASYCTVDGANPRSVTLRGGETGQTTFDVTCSGTAGEIQGTVTLDGNPAPNAQVSIDGTALGATPNAVGFYRIVNVTPGTYTVRAILMGSVVQTETVIVGGGETKIVNFAF